MAKVTKTEYVQKPLKKYIIMTIIGCVLIDIGTAFLILAPLFMATKPQNEAAFLAFEILGIIIVAGPGAALACIGTPLWIVTGIKNRVARAKAK